ncbi:MAG: BamA/TamA family outer membrane protein [Owenweeksia sp.]
MDQFLLYFPYRLFWNKSKYLTYGELGYYRYVYFYYGIGAKTPNGDEEIYSVTFPRIRNSFLYEFFPDTYIGGRYWYDDFHITKVDSSGLLAEHDVAGSRGGAAGGLGLVVNHDSRDDQFYPSEGSYIEGVLLPHGVFFGSDFSFLKISLDASRYYCLSEKQILAFNFYGESNIGQVPFYQMALLGGNKRLRGLYEGRFRDLNNLIIQTEYRWQFYKRFGLALFGSAGNTFAGLSEMKFNLNKYTYGGGLRFRLSKREKVNLRIDVGLSPYGSANYYVTFGEAF